MVVNERGRPIGEFSRTTGADGAFSFSIEAGEFTDVAVGASPSGGLELSSDSVFMPFRRDTEAGFGGEWPVE